MSMEKRNKRVSVTYQNRYFNLYTEKKKKTHLKSLNNYWQVNELNIDQQSTPCYILLLTNRNVLTMPVIIMVTSSY